MRSNSLPSPRSVAPELKRFNNVNGGWRTFELYSALPEGDVLKWSGTYHHSSEIRPKKVMNGEQDDVWNCHTAHQSDFTRPKTPPRSGTPSFFPKMATSSTDHKEELPDNITTTPRNRADTPPPSATLPRIDKQDEQLGSYQSSLPPELGNNSLPTSFVDMGSDDDTAPRLVDSDSSDEDEEWQHVRSKRKSTPRTLLWPQPSSTSKPKSSEQHADPNGITIET